MPNVAARPNGSRFLGGGRQKQLLIT